MNGALPRESFRNSIGGIYSLWGHLVSPIIEYQLGSAVWFFPLDPLMVLATHFWLQIFGGKVV